ncbi:hypothetical protein [Nitrobacter hamburgensis]|uniref:hypothetical protein n=1 Tax=Nitrobacter hamburgensis TaxID=912 RepID=UPI0012ED2838|nr:hypothetical protein [Nitrobacter hamburgensis]
MGQERATTTEALTLIRAPQELLGRGNVGENASFLYDHSRGRFAGSVSAIARVVIWDLEPRRRVSGPFSGQNLFLAAQISALALLFLSPINSAVSNLTA